MTNEAPKATERAALPAGPWMDEVWELWEESHRQAVLRAGPLPRQVQLRLKATCRRVAIQRAMQDVEIKKAEAREQRRKARDLRL